MNKRYFPMPTLDDAEISRALREGVDFLDRAAVRAFVQRVRTRDTMLTAEPASRTPDMGTLWTGGDPQRSPGADVERIFKSFTDQCGLLHPDDVQRIRALMHKLSGADAGTPNAMGITAVGQTTDYIADPGAREMRHNRDQVDSAVQSINAANHALWGGGTRQTTDARRRRDETSSPASVNAANREFWDQA